MKTRDYIFVAICTALNCTFFSLFVVKYSTEVLRNFFSLAGTIGDTIGGFSNLLLGLISITLIYKTYINQKESNDNSLSTSILNLLNEQLKQSKIILEKIQYLSVNSVINYGVDAVKQFELSLYNIYEGSYDNASVHSEKRKVYESTSPLDSKIIVDINDFLRSVLFIAEKTTDRKINNEDKLIIVWNIQDLINYYVINYGSISNLIIESITSAPRDTKEYKKLNHVHELNYFIQHIIEYDRLINRLVTFNIILTTEDKIVSFEEFFENMINPEININDLNTIKKRTIKIKNNEQFSFLLDAFAHPILQKAESIRTLLYSPLQWIHSFVW